LSGEPADGPIQAAPRGQRPPLPKRFYKAAASGAHEDGFGLFLDGRLVKTPGRRPLAVSRKAVADELAAEWGGQGENIDPSTMPMTRIVNAAIDSVADAMPAVRAEIVKYAVSDLICYRAEAPAALVDEQSAAWDPLVRWAKDELGARLTLAAGVVYVAQPLEALAAIDAAVSQLEPLRLAAVSTVTTLTGSAIIALAVARKRLSAERAWTVSLIDEEWEMRQWGRDEAALAARAFRWGEMAAAGLILTT
jgi:chaperone required for assembly of F1-ATPase